MADKKITELPVITGANLTSTDVLPVVDVSGDTTAQVTRAEFFLNTPSIQSTGPSTISVSSASDALRVTQTGTGNALLVEDSANPDSTPFVVSATGNVGIGTSAPAAPLNIVGNNFPLRFTGAAGGGAGGIEFYSDAGVTQATFDVNDTLQRVIVSVDPNNAWSNAGKVHLATSGSNRLSVDGNGLIGIGTASPATALNISGTTNGTGSGTACSISGNTLTVGGTVTGTWAVGDRVFGSGVDFNTVITALGTGTGGAGTYTLNNSMTVASTTMYAIGASRNVLRFTNTDTTELAGQPEGGIEFYGSDASIPGAGVKGYIATIAESGTPDTAMVFGTSDNVASTQALERMRITSAGRVGIGTSSPAQPLTIQAAVPTIQLVDSDLTTQVANIGGENGNVTIDIDPAQTAAASLFSVNVDNTERFRIASAGQIGIGGANYGTVGQVFTSGGSSAAPTWRNIPTYYGALSSPYTLTSTTAAQKLFNWSTNGALTLDEIGWYLFECIFTITAMSATSGNAKFDFLGAGTATTSSINYYAYGIDSSTVTTTVAAISGGSSVTVGTAASLATAGVGTAMLGVARGIFNCTAVGTIIPSISLVTAAAASVAAGSSFSAQFLGSSNTSAGWS